MSEFCWGSCLTPTYALGSQGVGANVFYRGREIGNHTNWELYTIMNNSSDYTKTSFYLNGQRVNITR
jgi:hypothetical protein